MKGPIRSASSSYNKLSVTLKTNPGGVCSSYLSNT